MFSIVAVFQRSLIVIISATSAEIFHNPREKNLREGLT